MAIRKPEATCPAAKFQQMISGKYKLRILSSLKDVHCDMARSRMACSLEARVRLKSPRGSQPRIKDAGANRHD